MSNTIAITVTETGGLDRAMDSRFGRSPAFLLVDAESGDVVAELENDATEHAHGAGTASAATMKEHGVHAVVSGRFGPKAYEALEALGVEMRLAPPGLTAREALARYQAGELVRMRVETFR